MSAPGNRMRIWPNSGTMANIPWEDTSGEVTGTGSFHLGPDGASAGMTIRVLWQDMPNAIQAILGYSYRDTNTLQRLYGTPTLRRKLPWQHPYFNQLYAKAITTVEGEIPQGNDEVNAIDLFVFGVQMGGLGSGYSINNGPWSVFQFAKLTISFWRPPYYMRTDSDIVAPLGPLAGMQQEWLRFVDKKWELNAQMLNRLGAQFIYAPGQGAVSGQPFQGSVGQKVAHLKVSRTWYQVPEACIFAPLPDGTPNGLPSSLMYMKTPTTNPVTGYLQPASAIAGVNGYQSYVILGCVNSPIGGGVVNVDVASGVDVRFLGCYTGTLLLEAIAITPRDLQLPPYLMSIPLFTANEPISQQQYDITFHFDLFDPPRPPSIVNNSTSLAAAVMNFGNPAQNTPALNSGPIQQVYRGHNLMPYQDGLWYMPVSQLTPIGASTLTTAFQYADFSDLFQVI